MGVSPKQALQNSNFLTTHARHTKFSGWANMKKSFPKRGSPKLKLFNLLKWIHEIVVSNFQLSYLKQPLHFCTSASFKRCFSSAGLTVSELRMQLRGKHLEALNAMHCNKALL